ncbi:MAG: C10 family peptidase, partial [Ekhidna sp.]|nr:C10 family peptidase [Ekhidna sp.]
DDQEYAKWYNCDAMRNHSGSTEVSRIMKNCGDAVGMDWGCDASSASISKVAPAFRNNFHYSSTSDKDFNYSTVESEIKSRRPVILSGGSKGQKDCFLGIFCWDTYENGHAWVCDGYKKNTLTTPTYTYSYKYLHMNWGWGAWNDWYSFNDWSVSNRSYNYKKRMIYNIRP